MVTIISTNTEADGSRRETLGDKVPMEGNAAQMDAIKTNSKLLNTFVASKLHYTFDVKIQIGRKQRFCGS